MTGTDADMPEPPGDTGALKWWLRLLEVEADRDLLLQTVKTLSDRVAALERRERVREERTQTLGRQRVAREGESSRPGLAKATFGTGAMLDETIDRAIAEGNAKWVKWESSGRAGTDPIAPIDPIAPFWPQRHE